MTDEQDSGNDEHEAPRETSEVKSVEPAPPPQSKPATEADLKEVEKQMNSFERSTLRWTRASFFIVLATAFFIGLQWLEMRSGGTDTHDLAVAAKDQAGKMKDMSEAADKIRQAAEGMVTKEQKLVESTQDSVRAIQRQMRTDQRAWVSIVRKPNSLQKYGEPIVMPVQMTNSGKTPAIHLHGAVSLVLMNRKDNVKTGPHLDIRPEVLAPGATETLPASLIEASKDVPPKPIRPLYTREMAAAIDRGDAYLMVYGNIDYTDVFGAPHWTKFCYLGRGDLDNRSTTLTPAQERCEKFNDVDRNPKRSN